MALAPALRSPGRWRAFSRPARPPLAIVIPGIDAIALGAAVLFGGPRGALGLALAAATFTALAAGGGQGTRINPRLSDDLPSLLGRLALPVLVVAPLAASGPALRNLILTAPAAAAAVVGGRALSYRLIREARSRGFVTENTLIVGAGRLAVRAALALRGHPQYGLAPVGFLDRFPGEGLPFPILGDVADLETVVRDFEVRRLVVAFGAAREPEIVPIIRACDRLPVEVHVMPRFFELGLGPHGAFADEVWDMTLIRLRRPALRTAAWRVKRTLDAAVAALGLVVLSPVFLASAAGVRLSSPGPVFFRQKRIGQRGEVFEMLKFRTLRENDDSDTTWSVRDDERRTRFGALLRRTSLDELPQLINVLRGEMSLVGPRPERPYFADRFRATIAGYDDRHRVPAGITGWAQVHGLRGDTSIEDRAAFDNRYVENWSLWRDLVILVRTVGAVFGASGA